MDTWFLNIDTNKLVFGVQWQLSLLTTSKILNTVLCKSRRLEALIWN